MSRYYLNVHDGVNHSIGEEGLEFDSLAAAERAAALTVFELGLRLVGIHRELMTAAAR
jgi:hypothetical protein